MSGQEERQLLTEVEAVLARRFAGAGDGDLPLRVGREMLGDAIDGLCRQQRQDPRWSPRALARGLERLPLPGLAWLQEDRRARRFAPAYLRLVARAVVLNGVEERICRDFGGSLSAPACCWAHTESLVAALSFLNARSDRLDQQIAASGIDIPHAGLEYTDLVREAILLGDALYDRAGAAEAVAALDECRIPGSTPMGAEMELGTLGARTVGARQGADAAFDSLYHFHDFALGARLRRLGGYRDDHTGVTFDASRSRGFLELAPGRLPGEGDLSLPATTDAGVLAALIREATRFAGIAPHSLHLSFQAEDDRPFTRLEDPGPLFCLLLLGGDLRPDAAGVLREHRVHDREIRNREGLLAFSRLNAHAAAEGAPPTRVVEFTFPRLADRSYEALILALKGLQRAANPLPLVAPAAEMDRRYYREMSGTLAGWAAAPHPVGDATIAGFLETVARGLQEEGASAHVGTVENALRAANDALCRAQG